MPGGYGAKWWRVSFARASRYRRIDVALSGAPVMANASGKNASRYCRAGVRHRDRDDFLRTSSSHGARNARRWLEFETESNVSGKGSIGRTGLGELCESFANFAVKSLQPQNAPRQRKEAEKEKKSGGERPDISANFASPLRTLRLRVFSRRVRQSSAREAEEEKGKSNFKAGRRRLKWKPKYVSA